ncbi:sulfite oxidase-like oxidoreductase [Bacillus sp. ISL-35]|uniref:sulfite oxidase-like oxidoreductase n=1 Tax=Bacillus sp. ISL-35 TaxID=2819122 RepID=UPI001BEA4947|nr:sulfite oxidase-like oxidoreductase [Bacillus sp. ISL-35]MBT2679071.1 sulfite oxidase-like oxidoreductase [Bacillus sp. ISL-35]MBT2704068.1 sulfite oxidase-like oxidoreductase [Chryseobacterium sp. ISL-80]
MYFGKPRKKGPSDRVPPNQNVTRSFPVLHYGNVPYYKNLDDWTLKIFGLVEKEVILSYKELMDLPQMNSGNDIHCVTGWSKLDNVWEGVSTVELARLAKPKEAAKYVILHAEENWTTNLPVEDFLRETSLLAHSHNGEPLTPEHGYPLRAVIPHLYFWKSAKWIRGIEFTSENRPGFWEENGYHMYGNPWKEQRMTWD